MDTNAVLDTSAMNRFISSLSKSLQALCHGCMDFDNGIEMIGYININIDSGNSVDCVLNEKVKRSSKTNSMTFISNSFLAKKEKAKVTRESTCSPIPELDDRDFSLRKSHNFSYGKATGRKRHRKEHLNTIHNSISQDQSEDIPSHQSEASEHPPDLNIQHHIKQEVNESSLPTNLSSIAVKREHTDLQSEDICQSERNSDLMCSGNISSDHPDVSLLHDYEHDQPSSELASIEQTLETFPPSTSQHLQGVENIKSCDDENDDNGEQSNIDAGDCSEDMNEQSSFMEADEKSTVPDEFEVIEIGDDDEVQELFAQSGPQNILGRHNVGSYQSGLVWNSNSSLHPTTCFSDPDMWRERKKQASRIYRLNMSHEQRERERWLARMRQRRRRARLRQQDSRKQALETQYNINCRHPINRNSQMLESSSMNRVQALKQISGNK